MSAALTTAGEIMLGACMLWCRNGLLKIKIFYFLSFFWQCSAMPYISNTSLFFTSVFFYFHHASMVRYGHISVSNQTLSPVFLVCPPLCPSDCVAVTSNFLLDPAEMGWAGCGLVPALPPSSLCCSASSRDFHTLSSSLLIPDILGYRIL